MQTERTPIYQLLIAIEGADSRTLLFRNMPTAAEIREALEAQIVNIEPRIVDIDVQFTNVSSGFSRNNLAADALHEERAQLRASQQRLSEYIELVKSARSFPLAASDRVTVNVAGVKIGTIELTRAEINENLR